jgi:hypothetical protein
LKTFPSSPEIFSGLHFPATLERLRIKSAHSGGAALDSLISQLSALHKRSNFPLRELEISCYADGNGTPTYLVKFLQRIPSLETLALYSSIIDIPFLCQHLRLETTPDHKVPIPNLKKLSMIQSYIDVDYKSR